MIRLSNVYAALQLSGCAALAPQPPPAPIPAPTPVPAPAPARPAVVTLPGAICDPARTGETILMVQVAVNKLTPHLEADPAYAGAWYEHAPCYRIVLAFKDGEPRPWVIARASPELRPYIAFARAPYSAAERERARLEISAAVAGAGIRHNFFVGSPLDKFTIGVRTVADAETVRRVIPDRYRHEVEVFVGDIEPRPEREDPPARRLSSSTVIGTWPWKPSISIFSSRPWAPLCSPTSPQLAATP